MNNQLSNTGSCEPLVSTLGPVEMCTQFFFKELLFNNNRLLYSDMYNMERYCIENLYWTRRLRRRRVQYRFSIQYGRVQYISILYIALYNDLFIIQLK
jgi:hypothetical protein